MKPAQLAELATNIKEAIENDESLHALQRFSEEFTDAISALDTNAEGVFRWSGSKPSRES